ncbi:MAG: HEAT repeat domain-containing protein [Armatimonas sp.]
MEEEIQALIEQLGDNQFSARKVAARKLERLGLQAAPGLRQVLYSPNPITVARAAQLLGILGDTEAIPRLRELLGVGNVDVVNAATDALRQIARHQQSDEARNQMLEELRIARKNVAAAQPSISPFAPSVPAMSLPSNPTSLEQAQRRAALSLPHTVAGLIATLGSKDYQKRSAATNALVEYGQEAVAPLCAVLEDRSPVVRQRAVEALGRIQDVAALTPLLALLRREAESMNAEASILTAIRDAVMLLIQSPDTRPFTAGEAIAMARLVTWQASIGIPSHLYVRATNRLIALAGEAPSPELRSALPYLKGIWPFVPREFAVARKAIEEATKAWADLPIASNQPASDLQNLPRPATELVEPVSVDLPMPAEKREKAKPPPLPTELDALIEALNSTDDDWCRRVEGALFVRGQEAVLPLRWAFVRNKTLAYQARIAAVLAGIGDPQAIVTIWVSWRAGQETEAKVSLKAALLRMGAQLPVLYERVALDDLLYLLPESQAHLPPLSEYVAQALERRAREAPTPELRRALPLLKGSWSHPVSPKFDSARTAIEKATTAWADLPIASSGPATEERDLPRPASESSGASPANLPRPSEDHT